MNFTLPDLDISFEQVVLKKASEFARDYLPINGIVHGYTGNIGRIKLALSSVYYDLPSQTDKFIFIRETMLHIAAIKGKYNEDIQKNLPANKEHSQRMLVGLAKANDILEEFQHYLAGLLMKDGYNLDTNAFSYEETVELNSQITDIIDSLNDLKTGMVAMAGEFDDRSAQIKTEFESLRSATILGKKSFFQLTLGKIGSYAGDKVADQIFEALKPQIILFFATQGPHLVDSFQKLLKP